VKVVNAAERSNMYLNLKQIFLQVIRHWLGFTISEWNFEIVWDWSIKSL